jgi:hypothetical protein
VTDYAKLHDYCNPFPIFWKSKYCGIISSCLIWSDGRCSTIRINSQNTKVTSISMACRNLLMDYGADGHEVWQAAMFPVYLDGAYMKLARVFARFLCSDAGLQFHAFYVK